MLKTSYYNFYIPLEEYNIYLLYNSLFNGMHEISFEKGKYLSRNKKIREENFYKLFNPKERELLTDSHMVINSQISECDIIKNRSFQARKTLENKGIRLAILPTYECNLSCPYCFEEYKPNGIMSKTTMNRIAKVVEDIH